MEENILEGLFLGSGIIVLLINLLKIIVYIATPILLIGIIIKIDKTNKMIYEIRKKQKEINKNINDIKDTQDLIKIKIDKFEEKKPIQ